MNSKERLLSFIKYKGISKRKFYDACGLSNAFLDKVGNIGAGKLEQIISTYPELNGEWVITGKGEMLQTTETFNPQQVNEPLHKYVTTIKTIPLIPIDALAGLAPGELVIKDSDIESRYTVPDFAKADFLIRVKGGSMYPKYSSGDVLACKKVSKTDFIQWNKTYVIDTSHGVLVKRILKGKDDKHWILRSENKDYQDIDVNPEKDIHHINIVIGVIRLE